MNDYSFTLRGGRMNLVSKLEETASEKPDSIACRFKDRMMTYQELNEHIQRFADGLQEAGMEKGDHLALLLGNSPDFYHRVFWCVKGWDCGGAHQPAVHAHRNRLYADKWRCKGDRGR